MLLQKTLKSSIVATTYSSSIIFTFCRYGTQWSQGYVTTFKPENLNMLKSLLSQTPEPLTQAGLHPTADQIELYAYHLPHSTLSNLMVSSTDCVKLL